MIENRFGLKKEIIEKIQSVFAKEKKIEKVIIYGSRAKGNHRPGSDIDLTLMGKELTTTDLLRIENELDDLLLPYQFDLSIYHQIENKEFLNHIQRVGIPFHS